MHSSILVPQIKFHSTSSKLLAAQQKYELTDQTRRPSDVMVYLKSEEDKGSRTGKSTSASDEVIAKAIQRKLEFGQKNRSPYALPIWCREGSVFKTL